jgi:hypothetical protein
MEIKDKIFYRVLERLSYGSGYVEPGAFHALERCNPEAIEALIAHRSISPVAPPPLVQLPGWTRRAERFGELGVQTVTQLLATDRRALAEALDVKPETMQRWRDEALGWMVVSPKRSG